MCSPGLFPDRLSLAGLSESVADPKYRLKAQIPNTGIITCTAKAADARITPEVSQHPSRGSETFAEALSPQQHQQSSQEEFIRAPLSAQLYKT